MFSMPPMGLSGKKFLPAVPVFVASSTVQNGIGDNTVIVTKPAGTVEGDLLVFLWLGSGTNKSAIIGGPVGWVSKHSASFILDATSTFEVCEIVTAGPAEPASYTWGLNGSNGEGVACILTYRPTHATQVDIIAGGVMGNPSISHTPPGVTTVQNNARIVAAYMLDRNGASSAFISGSPAGMTQRLSVNGDPVGRNDLLMEVYDDDTIVSPAGIYTPKSATAGSSNHYGYGITIGIRAI